MHKSKRLNKKWRNKVNETHQHKHLFAFLYFAPTICSSRALCKQIAYPRACYFHTCLLHPPWPPRNYFCIPCRVTAGGICCDSWSRDSLAVVSDGHTSVQGADRWQDLLPQWVSQKGEGQATREGKWITLWEDNVSAVNVWHRKCHKFLMKGAGGVSGQGSTKRSGR